jgi:hypothetical protein
MVIWQSEMWGNLHERTGDLGRRRTTSPVNCTPNTPPRPLTEADAVPVVATAAFVIGAA